MKILEKNLRYQEFNTRSAADYHLNTVRLKSTQNSVQYLGLTICKELPSHIKVLEGVQFKYPLTQTIKRSTTTRMESFIDSKQLSLPKHCE